MKEDDLIIIIGAVLITLVSFYFIIKYPSPPICNEVRCDDRCPIGSCK